MILPTLKVTKWTLPHSLPRYAQVIDKSTPVVNNSMSCIELISCTNKNIISNHGVDVTIFEKCHHNSIYAKINVKVRFPPVYIREV